jgi:hypothetical protein
MNAWTLLGEPLGQGWYQLAELSLAFVAVGRNRS